MSQVLNAITFCTNLLLYYIECRNSPQIKKGVSKWRGIGQGRSPRPVCHSMGPPALTLFFCEQSVILTIRREQPEKQPVPRLVCTPRLCNSPEGVCRAVARSGTNGERVGPACIVGAGLAPALGWGRGLCNSPEGV